MTLKQRTMKLTGWTSSQYDKEYDKFRNRVRTYERITASEKSRNVAQTLYYTQKEMTRAAKSGTAPKLSAERRAIMSTPSRSSSKPYNPRVDDKLIKQQIESRFGGLIDASNVAKGIMNDNSLTMPEKHEKLRQYADKIQNKKAEINAKAKRGQADGYDFEELYGYDVEL